MKKSLLIVIIIVVILAVVFSYFYFFHSFYTVRICVSGENFTDLNKTCSNNSECLDFVSSEVMKTESLFEMHDLVKQKLEETLNAAVFCESTCKLRRIYGMGFSDVEEVDRCLEGETEIKLEIHGKEGLKLYKFMQENKSS